MRARFDVLSYGTVGLDYIIRVPYWPTPGLGAHAPGEEEHIGGKAANVAVFLARWGVSVAISGNVIGDDAVGQRLLDRLAAIPFIHTDYLERQPGLASMFCRVLVNPHGERAIIGIRVDEIPQTLPTAEMIGCARLLTLDLYGGDERIVAARMAAEAGKPVVVGDLRRFDHPVVPFTSVAIASAEEIRREYHDLAPADFAARAWQAGAANVVITGGAEDVLVFTREGTVTAITPPEVAVVDSTGAGDAFRAGIVFGLLAGWSLVEAAAMGTAAGSLNVTRAGAASSPSAAQDTIALARQLPRRTEQGMT